jgi:hypothetical protein
MRTPDEIENEISKLMQELIDSKEYYQYELICTIGKGKESEKIGSFDIDSCKKILKKLYDNNILQYRHGLFKNVDVYMNPQKNRILVSKNDSINESNIISFMLWHPGDWYINNEE